MQLRNFEILTAYGNDRLAVMAKERYLWKRSKKKCLTTN